jgi:hypothetical protein
MVLNRPRKVDRGGYTACLQSFHKPALHRRNTTAVVSDSHAPAASATLALAGRSSGMRSGLGWRCTAWHRPVWSGHRGVQASADGGTPRDTLAAGAVPLADADSAASASSPAPAQTLRSCISTAKDAPCAGSPLANEPNSPIAARPLQEHLKQWFHLRLQVLVQE